MTNVLVITLSDYRFDTRIQRHCDALVAAGANVDVVAFGEAPSSNSKIAFSVIKKRRNKEEKFFKEVLFAAAVIIRVFRIVRELSSQKAYDVCLVNNMPNCLVFACMRAKNRGARIVLDIHDPLPELGYLKAPWWVKRLVRKIFLIEELISTKYADRVLTVNKAMAEILSTRNKVPVNIIHNSPVCAVSEEQRETSYLSEGAAKLMPKGATVLVEFHGNIHRRTGLYEFLAVWERVIKTAKFDLQMRIHGQGPAEQGLREKYQCVRARGGVIFEGAFYPSDVPFICGSAHVSVVPTPPNGFNKLVLPVKLLEAAKLGNIVIARALPIYGRYDLGKNILTYESDAELESLLLELPQRIVEFRASCERGFQDETWEMEAPEFLRLVLRRKSS